MLVNIHKRDDNVGDIMSSTSLYFKSPQETKTIDIMNLGDSEILNNDIGICLSRSLDRMQRCQISCIIKKYYKFSINR
jgi:hypothetical protein